MNKFDELSSNELDQVDGCGSGTSAYDDGKEIGKRVGQAIEDFFEGVIEVWTDGK